MSPRRRLVAAGALIGLGIVAYDPHTIAEHPKRALLLAASVLATGWWLTRRASRDRPASRLGWVWLAWCGYMASTLLWGGLGGVLDIALLVGAVAFGLSLSALGERTHQLWVRACAASVGTASAAIALVQYGTGSRGIELHGGHGNNNWLGLTLLVTLPITVDWAWASAARSATAAAHPTRHRGGWVLAIAAVAQVALISLARSRTALVGLVLGAVLVFVAQRSRRRFEGVLRRIAFGWVGLAIVASVSLGAVASSSAPGSGPSLFGRAAIWASAADAAASRPFVGAGAGQAGHAIGEAQGSRLQAVSPVVAARHFENAQRAHSSYWDALLTSGVVGLALLAWVLASGLHAQLAARRYGGAVAVAGVVVACVGDSVLAQPAALVLTVLVASAPVVRLPTRAPDRRVARAVQAAVWLACALLMWPAATTWYAARQLVRARTQLPDAELRLLARAASLAPLAGRVRLQYGLALLRAERPELAERELASSWLLFSNVGTQIARGNAAVLSGKRMVAVARYRDALARHPGSLRARANLASVQLARGELSDARRHIDVARRLSPGHPKIRAIAAQLRDAENAAESN